MKRRILYVGGKSGGHIIPMISCARAQSAGTVAALMALDRPLDRKLAADAACFDRTLFVSLATIYSRKIFLYPRYLYELMRAAWQAIAFMRAWRPTEVVASGGYVTCVAVIAARCLRIPVVLYALDAVPGTAVRVSSFAAQEIRCCFASARAYFPRRVQKRVVNVAYPLRFHKADIPDRASARAACGIPLDAFVLVVFGGSQGARAVNDAVAAACAGLPEHMRVRVWVLHQAGGDGAYAATIADRYRAAGVSATVINFTDDVITWLGTADCIVTRAGAGALHECGLAGVPLVIMPLMAHAQDHQLYNARMFLERCEPSSVVLLPNEYGRLAAHIASLCS